MIYAGFRVTPGPGQGLALMPLVARVNQLVSKHGGKPIANFAVAFGGPGSGDHIHIFGYQDWAAVGASGEALQADPDWQKLIAETGPKIASLASSILQPMPGSPLQ